LQGIVDLFHRLQKHAKAIDAQARYSIKETSKKMQGNMIRKMSAQSTSFLAMMHYGTDTSTNASIDSPSQLNLD